jgi:hypothetical protein
MDIFGCQHLPFVVEDSPNNNRVRRATAYLGLYLVSLGTEGIKSCTTALGADQFDGGDMAERVTKASFFNWYYLLPAVRDSDRLGAGKHWMGSRVYGADDVHGVRP